MYDETKLEEDVLTWVNSFTSIKVFVHAFAELSNGVALFRILNEVDEDIWKLKDVIIDDLNDKNIKYQNLTKVFEGLIHFYDEKLDIMVSNSFIDIEAISEIDEDFDGKANKSIDHKLMNKTLTKLCFTIHSTKAFSPSFNIAKSMTPRGLITKAPNVHDLLKLCEMVIDVTVKCDNKEIFIKQVQDLNEITQIGLMTCIQNIEHYLRKDQEIEEFSYSTLKEKHNPLFKMLTLNAKSIDNISLNQSFTSAEKLDRIIKDSLYDIKESTVEVNGFNLPLNSARTLDDSTEIIEINIDETKLKSRIQALEGQIKIYKSNQNEMSSRNKEMNEVIKKLLKDKKNFEKLKKKLSSKDSQAKLQAVCPETLKHIADIEADLEQKKTENSNLQKDNYNLRRKITEFEEMQQKDEEAGKMYSQELIQEIDSLKIKLATIQDVSIINEEYKAKVEELLEHKAKYDEIFNENESLRRQLFSNELIRNTEQRYQDLYKSLKEEHSNTKDLLTSAEIEIRKLKDETNDIKADLERVQTNNSKKDEIISQLRLDIEKCKLIQICGGQGEHASLEEKEYEDKVIVLQEEIEELRRQNENYANNEIVKLENILQTQNEQSQKEKKEKYYFEERCSILEKQNFELKNQIENHKLDSLSEKAKNKEVNDLTNKISNLKLKIENLEEKLAFEKSKFDIVHEENAFLKKTIDALREEKDKLAELLNKNFGILESLNENIKSMESSRIHDNSQLDLDQSFLLSECSRDFGSFKRENDMLKREVMKLKMEIKFQKTIMSLVDKTSPNCVLYSCIQYIKMCYAMYIKAKYTNIIKSSPVKLTPRKR